MYTENRQKIPEKDGSCSGQMSPSLLRNIVLFVPEMYVLTGPVYEL